MACGSNDKGKLLWEVGGRRNNVQRKEGSIEYTLRTSFTYVTIKLDDSVLQVLIAPLN